MKEAGRRILLLLISTSALLSLQSSVAAASSIILSGAVVNGTQGGAVPSGLEVTIVQLDKAQKEVARRSTRTDLEGRFSVEGFERLDGARYLALTTYQGVAYSKISDAAQSQEGLIELRIFETTTDDGSIEVDSETLTIVQGVQDQMEILQVVRVANRSDRTFVGRSAPSADETPITIRLPLPEGAFDVALSDILRERGVEATPEGLGTGEPVLPGESSYSFAYKVRVPRSGWQLRRPIVYSTLRIDLLVDDGLTTTAPGFELQEKPELGGKKYRRYRDGPFLSGDILGVDVGYPAASSGSGLTLGIGGAVLLLISVGGLALAARKRRDKNENLDRKELIHRIAELDEAFAQGRIEQAAYASSRARMKKELMEATDVGVPDGR